MKRFHQLPYLMIGMFLTIGIIPTVWAQDKPNILVI